MAINNRDTFSKKVRSQYNQNELEKGLKIPNGVYRGIVVDVNDPNREGRIKVQVMKFYSTFPIGDVPSSHESGSEFLGAFWCRQLLPFGATSQPTEGPNGVVSQNTNGIFGPPPALDNEVLVAFSGDTQTGIILGVLLDPKRSEGIAGAGVTKKTASGETTIGMEVSKTAESPNSLPDEHPQAEVLRKQGLDKDRIRGQNFSSPTRDPISRVMGMSTPAGHCITMDDGDLEDGDNLSIRIRTAGGAQILMDDTNGLIYINNREGNAWIEMNRYGDIDIYSKGNISYHSEGDYNIHCGGNFNVQAGRNINMKAMGSEGIKLHAAAGSFNMKCESNMNLEAGANGNLKIAGNYRETAARIDMNGPAAASASVPASKQHTGNKNITESISSRVPEAEPWAGHLDVSVIDSTSAAGVTDQSNSKSYYYGSPTDMHSYNDQTGEFDLNNFPPVEQSAGSLLQYNSNVDRRIDPKLIEIMTEVARRFGRPLTITSGYRSPSYNAKVGGAKRSQHMLGKAVDISGSGLSDQDRLDLAGIASSLGIRGIGIYNSGSMHFDIREGPRAAWGSDYTSASIPSYARTTLEKHMSGGFA